MCVCVCTDEGVGYPQGSNVNVLSFKKNAIVDTSSSGADIGDDLLPIVSFFFSAVLLALYQDALFRLWNWRYVSQLFGIPTAVNISEEGYLPFCYNFQQFSFYTFSTQFFFSFVTQSVYGITPTVET